MNDLKKEIKKSVLAAQEQGNKFVEDPLWESQAWFLRTRLRFGNDYQQFWDHTQGQINDYVENLNSEDQIRARAEVAESFTLAIKTGFDDCNKQMDSLLKKVFQVKQIENGENQTKSKAAEPEIINLLDVEEESVVQRKQVDPPSKFDQQKADPEPAHTVTSSIVAVLEESITEDTDYQEETLSEPVEASEEEEVPSQTTQEVVDASMKDVSDDLEFAPRNDRLEVAIPHRALEPEITNLVMEEPEEESPEVIDLTDAPEETRQAVEIVQAEEEKEPQQIVEIVDLDDEDYEEDMVGHDARDDYYEPTPGHSRSLSLTSILLATYELDHEDAPGRAQWYNASVLASIVSKDTEDEDYYHEEPTIQTVPSKCKEILSTLAGMGSPTTHAPESVDDVEEGRECADESDRVQADSCEGSRMEPIDLTQA